MKKAVVFSSVAVIAAATLGNLAIAQEAPETETEVEVEVEETDASGAVVTRETIVEEREALDENDEPVIGEDGQPVTETAETGWQQTVETPSDHVHTITKEEGSNAVVTHERPDKAERPERLEKPDLPEKPEKPDKPDEPGRPD